MNVLSTCGLPVEICLEETEDEVPDSADQAGTDLVSPFKQVMEQNKEDHDSGIEAGTESLSVSPLKEVVPKAAQAKVRRRRDPSKATLSAEESHRREEEERMRREMEGEDGFGLHYI